MKNDLEFMAIFHKRASDLYEAFIDARGDEEESLRNQWCEADNTFRVFFGMTLYEANRYFIDSQGNRKA
jgi:hypothetical protein